MKVRPLLLTLAALGIPAALLILVLPITWGYGGYYELLPPGAAYGQVVYSDPSGPAYAAGLRVGQRVRGNTGQTRMEDDAGPVGTVARIKILDRGAIRVIPVTFVPFTGTLMLQQIIDKVVDALTALLAFAVSILVLLRARDRSLGIRSALVLALAGASALVQSGSLVCNNATLAFWLSYLLPAPLTAATLWAVFSVLAVYPAEQPKLRRILAWCGPIACIDTLLGSAALLVDAMTSKSILGPLTLNLRDLRFVGAVTLAAAIVACIDAAMKAPRTQAVAVRWLSSLWICAIAFELVPLAAFVISSGSILSTHYGDILHAGYVACLSFGVVYPVLRYRMLDLNILISRATVFTTVSLLIVGIFIAAEWAIGKIFEQSFGLSNDRGGLGAQIVTLGVVLALGISARSIHRFVDERLTKTFFKKRLDGLAAIESAAHEADAATDSRAVIEIAVQTAVERLEIVGAAIYLRAGSGYERVCSRGSFSFQEAYGFNDVPPLKLRRWLKDYEGADGALFLPMLVRGDLVGFLVCGPKQDHTAYLSDDIAALQLLAHHAGLAQALLHRMPALTEMTLAPG